MTDNINSEQTTPIRTNSDLLWAEEVIEQAIGIIMNRFDLDAVRALEVLPRMSLDTRTQMCVVSEQVIKHDLPVDAMRGVEELRSTASAEPQDRKVVGPSSCLGWRAEPDV